jgi:hypothetical protein
MKTQKTTFAETNMHIFSWMKAFLGKFMPIQEVGFDLNISAASKWFWGDIARKATCNMNFG